MSKMALQKAVDLVGGQQALAKAISVKQQNVWNWLNRNKNEVPAEYCRPIETATGGAVKASDLRPDIYGPAPAKRRKVAA